MQARALRRTTEENGVALQSVRGWSGLIPKRGTDVALLKASQLHAGWAQTSADSVSCTHTAGRGGNTAESEGRIQQNNGLDSR